MCATAPIHKELQDNAFAQVPVPNLAVVKYSPFCGRLQGLVPSRVASHAIALELEFHLRAFSWRTRGGQQLLLSAATYCL